MTLNDARSLIAQCAARMNTQSGSTVFDEWAAAAAGTAYDACVRIGAGAYLWWNNTNASMAEIRETGAWLPAQKTFMDLCEAFRTDPVVDTDS